MKYLIVIKRLSFTALLFPFVLACTGSCTNRQNTMDTKLIAEENNEVKYDNSDKGRDAMFLVDAAETDLAEIELGQLAEQNGHSASVKALARMMAVTHSQSLHELILLAVKKSIAIPTSQTENVRAAFKKLGSKSGAGFDKEYCDIMVDRHKDAIILFDKATRELSDPDIKRWATGTLPSLYTQLDSALNCQKIVGKP